MGVHIVPDGPGDSRLKSAFMGAAVACADTVNIALEVFVRRLRPNKGRFHPVAVFTDKGESQFGDLGLSGVGNQHIQKFGNPARMAQIVGFLGHLIHKENLESGMDIGHGIKVVFDLTAMEFDRFENLRIRSKENLGAMTPEWTHPFDLAIGLAFSKLLLPLKPVAFDGCH